MTNEQNNRNQPAPTNMTNINELEDGGANLPAPPRQLLLDVGIRVERDINGIEMGVLENGMPYLTQRGLARMTGLARSTIFDLSKEWEEKYSDTVIGKGRNDVLKDILFKKGYREPTLYMSIVKDGSVHYAYPDVVCMTVLEYYAFDAQRDNQDAIRNYRNLATYGLQKFIYDALQYVPVDRWLYFRDRVSILSDSVRQGFFSVFREINGLIVDLINIGLTVDDRTIPDISVGKAWSQYWANNGLDAEYGARIQYEHNYPAYYPQAESNPQPAWSYLDAALPRFRLWFREEYLPTKFPLYILRKAKLLPGGKLEAEQIAARFDHKLLEE